MEISNMLEITDILEKTEDTLSSLWNQFELFCPKCLQFKMGQCISTLLQQDYMLHTECEVINCVFILCHMAQPQNINPFNKALYNYINKPSPDPRVHAASYLLSLLPFTRQTLSCTTSQILQNVKSSAKPNLKTFPYSPKLDCTLPILIDDPENDSKETAHYKEVLSQLFNSDYTDRVFVPPVRRLSPPLHQDEDEVLWMCPNDNDYRYECYPDIVQQSDSESKKLFNLALKQALEPSQYASLKKDLYGSEEVIQSLGLSPPHLPKLVHKNPSLAVDILLILAHSPHFGDYLHILINMELSLHSMEVVNKITANLELPPQFIHFYIRNCITSCNDITDKHTQHRFVRLVCVFLTALIRNRLVNVQDILVEIQAFCIDHSRIREATGLFRLLKTLDNKDNE